MQLSTIRYTHMAILRDDRELPLTESQYQTWRLQKQDDKASSPITICDWPWLPIRYDWECGQCKEFKEIRQSESAKRKYICDYWWRHPISESCECIKKYKLNPSQFREKMLKCGIKYVSDVNDLNRNKILNA